MGKGRLFLVLCVCFRFEAVCDSWVNKAGQGSNCYPVIQGCVVPPALPKGMRLSMQGVRKALPDLTCLGTHNLGSSLVEHEQIPSLD